MRYSSLRLTVVLKLPRLSLGQALGLFSPGYLRFLSVAALVFRLGNALIGLRPCRELRSISLVPNRCIGASVQRT